MKQIAKLSLVAAVATTGLSGTSKTGVSRVKKSSSFDKVIRPRKPRHHYSDKFNNDKPWR